MRLGGAPEVSAADGLLATTIGVAAHKSIAQGRPIELGELLSSEMLTSLREERREARARSSSSGGASARAAVTATDGGGVQLTPASRSSAHRHSGATPKL